MVYYVVWAVGLTTPTSYVTITTDHIVPARVG